MNNFNTADKLEEILKDNNIDAVYSLKFNDKKNAGVRWTIFLCI